MANVFPKWVNSIPIKVIVALLLIKTAVVLGVTYYATPKYTRVGYAPTQPVPFSHALHVGQLEMDCRHCHTFVDRSEHSNVPATDTCMSCHSMVRKNDPVLAPCVRVTNPVSRFLGCASTRPQIMFTSIMPFM